MDEGDGFDQGGHGHRDQPGAPRRSGVEEEIFDGRVQQDDEDSDDDVLAEFAQWQLFGVLAVGLVVRYNDLIKEKLGYAPSVKLADGLKVTYEWIEGKIKEELAAVCVGEAIGRW